MRKRNFQVGDLLLMFIETDTDKRLINVGMIQKIENDRRMGISIKWVNNNGNRSSNPEWWSAEEIEINLGLKWEHIPKGKKNEKKTIQSW